MDEPTNLTVICKCAAPSGPGLGAIIVEVLTFLFIAGAVALGAALLR